MAQYAIRTKDDFERFVVDTLRENPFLAMVSRYIRKLPSDKVPTAGVTYDPKTDDITMYYNLDFMSGLDWDQCKGTFHHELYHIIWDHIAGRRRDPHVPWNIATDLSINSIITNENKGKLPDGVFIPGVRPKMGAGGKIKSRKAVQNPDGTVSVVEFEREQTKEEKGLNESFANLIEKMPHAKASEWYFDRLAEWSDKNGGSLQNGDSGIDSFDDHDGWNGIPEDMKDLVSGKVRSIVEKAVQHADSQADGWGNMPAELRNEIRRFVSKSVDWRRVLRYFVGIMCRGHRTPTFKRINRRYPYIAPGAKRGYRARVAIFIDQSGSVSDENITRVFAALNTLSKQVEFDVFMFDTEVDVKNGFTWKKNQIPKQLRTRCGGTDFEAPTRFVNDPKNRGRWDGYIIMTDGECSKPSPSRAKRAWIIVPDHKLLFEVDEMVVHMTADNDVGGR